MIPRKWFPQQQVERAAKKGAVIPATLALPSSADAKKFGLENFGNTCYANSVLQALYFCTPFRELLLQDSETALPLDSSPVIPSLPNKSTTPLVPLRRKPESKPSTSGHAPEVSILAPPTTSINHIPSSPPTLFSALQSLFLNISTNPSDKGTVSPRAFIEKLKELNDIFRSTMHQDAHEFLNYLLNKIVEEIEEEKKQGQNGTEDLSNSVATLGSRTPPTVLTATSSNSGTHPHEATLVHKLFEGILTSETRCLTCETVSSRDESFLDLSIDIEQNSSVTACLRQFSASEMLCQRNKFFCDSCCDLQEAEKRMKIKKLPNVLALHLKRFKYQEDVAKYIKLAYRVAFPFELRLFNTVDDIDDADRLFNLFAIVVHIGNGPHHGHYISIIKTLGTWLVFDDDNVYPIPESDIPKYFGDSNSGSAYVLYYQATDIDLVSLGLRTAEPPAFPEVFTNIIPPLQVSQASQSQKFPSLPPGLNTVTIPEGGNEILKVPPLTTPNSIRPVSQDRVPVAISIPQLTDPTSGSSSLSRLGSKLRRPPSTSAVLASAGSPTNGNETRQRSPRPSPSIPSFIGSIDSSSAEPPPPIPPLPSTVINDIQSPAIMPPIHIPQVNEPEKEEKEKLKLWFIKRKSLKGEKSRPDRSPTRDVPASPIQRSEDAQQSWFKPSPSTAPRFQRRPSDNGSASATLASEIFGRHPDALQVKPASSKYGRDRTTNGYDRSHSPGSASSSPGSSSPLNTVQVSAPGTRPSTSSTVSGYQIESPPPPARKLSLTPSPAERVRTRSERKKSVDLKSVAPLSLSSTFTSQLPPTYYNQSLPPLPSTSNFQSFYPPNSNVFEIESEGTSKGKRRSTDEDGIDPGVSTSSQPIVPPVSLAASWGGNYSSGSTNSSSSNFKRATRKLSLTAPMLGFGRRDKDKEKDREREKVRER